MAGAEPRLVQDDITSWADIKRMAELAFGEAGGIDVLINNVGDMASGQASWREVTEEAIDHVLTVDLKGTMLIVHEFGQRVLHDRRRRLQHARSLMAANGQNTEDVYERVRAAILDGELAAGSVMSQVALAEEFGISRTPLREALRMLQSEGLVEGEPNRRVRVAPMTVRDLEELCVMRITLEAEALRLSVPRMTSEDIARLEGHMAEMAHYAQEKDYRRWTVPHREFHRALTAHAGERVNVVLGQMFDHAERYRRLHIGHGPSAWATPQHRAILDACKARDREGAGGLLAGHLARTGFEVADLLDPAYDPEQLRTAVLDAGGEIPKRRRARRTTRA
jgi:GntR family transcriptional regulator, rspAB operon transcriptional repressor